MSNFDKINNASSSKKKAHVHSHTEKKILPFKNQIYEDLKKECIKSGKLFEDPFFPAVDKSIFYNQPIPNGTKWARPKDISTKPMFIDNVVDANDLDQGYLGDCMQFLK
jgi:hypothetical protein